MTQTDPSTTCFRNAFVVYRPYFEFFGCDPKSNHWQLTRAAPPVFGSSVVLSPALYVSLPLSAQFQKMVLTVTEYLVKRSHVVVIWINHHVLFSRLAGRVVHATYNLDFLLVVL
jgi:hypothetical protein